MKNESLENNRSKKQKKDTSKIDLMEVRSRIDDLLTRKTGWGRNELKRELDHLFMTMLQEQITVVNDD